MARFRQLVIAGGLIVTVSIMMSCSIILDSLIGGAASGVGKAVGEHAEKAAYERMAPDEKIPQPNTPGWGNFMAMQAQVIFTYTFNSGMQMPIESNYKPGQWTRHELSGVEDDATTTLERALLKQTDDGNTWWQFSWSSDGSIWLYEGLVNDTTGKLVRLRGKDPEGNVGEIPVSETSVNQSASGNLTEESMEGAKVGTEKVTTPAGTFTAEKYEFMGGMGGDTMQMWLTSKVPGGMVQYQVTSDGELAWKSVLADYGEDATTKLDSF